MNRTSPRQGPQRPVGVGGGHGPSTQDAPILTPPFARLRVGTDPQWPKELPAGLQISQIIFRGIGIEIFQSTPALHVKLVSSKDTNERVQVWVLLLTREGSSGSKCSLPVAFLLYCATVQVWKYSLYASEGGSSVKTFRPFTTAYMFS